MTFYNSLLIKLGLAIEDSIGGTKITIVDFNGIVIEGHKGVFSYSKEQIVVNIKKHKISISGSNLFIVEINTDEVYIKGKIEDIKNNYE